MQLQVKSVRAFIGAKDFGVSRAFYNDLGFEESVISKTMSYFKIFESLGFYLQDYYVREWIDNTMIFVEVEDVDMYWSRLSDLGLQQKYKEVRLVPIRDDVWGRECFLHDPSGILWHFGEFKK